MPGTVTTPEACVASCQAYFSSLGVAMTYRSFVFDMQPSTSTCWCSDTCGGTTNSPGYNYYT
jgi:hypothetical protein